MAGLVPAIHVFAVAHKKTWMPGINPGMTEESMRMNLYPVQVVGAARPMRPRWVKPNPATYFMP